jgi:catechol 2,3-dioxygenase-like lactoylglutathione lyase family enzyme
LTNVDPSGMLITSKIINVMIEPQEEPMSRVQLALNVADLHASIEFYTKLFSTPPAKVREDYANFAIAEPPLKLVLIAGQGEPGTLNHVGVEVTSTDEVAAAATRMAAEGVDVDVQEATTCCYAVQDKVWVSGPEIAWEIYTVLADASVMHPAEGECCVDAEADAETVSIGAKPNACC